MATAAEVIAGGAAWGVDCSDALAGLRGLPDGCVQCCLTSPPFFSLRDYGTATWEGGSPDCDHKGAPKRTQAGFNEWYFGRPAGDDKQGELREPYRAVCGKCGARRVDRQIGLEDTPDAYVARLVDVFREVRRVLHPSGVLWLNLGDGYAAGSARGGGNHLGTGQGRVDRAGAAGVDKRGRGVKAKNLIGAPWLTAFALRDDGWYLRCAPPLVKDNCMPESVTDRLTTAHEYWFLLAKSARYFWDADAVRVPAARPGDIQTFGGSKGRAVAPAPGDPMFRNGSHQWGRTVQTGLAGRNLRTSDVFDQGLDDLIEQERAWLAHLEHVRAQGGMLLDRDGDPLALLYSTFAFPGAHFATFSPHMITPLLKAATSERGCCPACRAPWVRLREPDTGGTLGASWHDHADDLVTGNAKPTGQKVFKSYRRGATTGWRPSCACPPADAVPCLVLDCFAGSGTVGLVARRLGRRFVGFDLNEQYVTLARQRIESDAPLFNGAAPAPASSPERTLFDSLAPKED